MSPKNNQNELLPLSRPTVSYGSSVDNDEEAGASQQHYLLQDEHDEEGHSKLVVVHGGEHEHVCTKSIGYIGGLAIAINSLAGPAILQLPYQYQQSGFIPTSLCLVAVGCLSSLCCLYMASTVSAIPNNGKFQQSIEFSDAFGIFWNRTAYQVTQVLFFLCTICLNVAAMIDTAQVVDSALGVLSPHSVHTYALDAATMHVSSWTHDACTRKQAKLRECVPFSDEEEYGTYLLTAGYVLTALVFLPICLMDLKENTSWQIWGCTLLLTLSAYFCAVFYTMDEKALLNIPAHVGTTAATLHPHNGSMSTWGHEYRSMLGVILFNFSLVLAIPAWLHEKKAHVSVHKVVLGSTAVSTFLYICVGALAARAIPHANVNMLSPMLSGAFGKGMQVGGSVFAFFIIGLDIPLFSVLTRYNLTHSGMCSPRTANLLVVWLPWSISWILYQGDAIGELLDWGGVLLTSAVAFILPLYLALRVLRTTDQVPSVAVFGENLWTSRTAQTLVLYSLLIVTATAIMWAIGGQIVAQESQNAYLRSEEYLNGTLIAA